MRRRQILWLVLSHAVVAAVVWVGASGRGRTGTPAQVPPHLTGPIYVTETYEDPTRAGDPRVHRTCALAPYSIRTGDDIRKLGPAPAPGAPLWQVSFGEGQVWVSCAQVMDSRPRKE